MKKIIIFNILFFLLSFSGIAQNIPHANTTGPYGVQVNTFNGNLHFQRMDLAIPNTGVHIDLSFAYNSFRDSVQFGYGKGFTFTYNMMYELDSTGVNYIVQRPDGRSDLFKSANGNYAAPEGIFDTWEEYQTGQFVLTTKYGMAYYFDDNTHGKLTRLRDANGNEISISYTGGNPTVIQDQSGRSVQLLWSGDLLQSVLDNNFSETRQIQYAYDAEGHLTSVIDPEGGEMTYTYNEDFLIKVVNERDDFVDITYDESERVNEMVSCATTLKMQYHPEQHRTYAIEKNAGGDRMTTFVYNEEGNLQSKIGSCCGYNTQYQYDNDLNTNQLMDANGNLFTANHDQTGNALVTTDPMAGNQSFEFGNLNRLTSFTDKNGNLTSFDYDTEGNLETIQQPLNISLNFDYDAAGNITSLVDGNGHQTTMTYNTNNDVTLIEYPEPGTGESFMYDGVGNVTQSTDANSNATYYVYDKLNRLKSIRDDLNNEVQFGYDAASNLILEMDANQNEKTYGYDANHRLEMVSTPTGTTHYFYDESDNLTSIRDANEHATTFSYDDRNLLTEEVDAEGNATRYAYDGNGNLMTKTDANGDVTNYQYDQLNRLVEKSYKGNTDVYAYDANGNLTYCANNDIALSFTYDALNRLTSKTVLNWSLTISYEYDGAGNRTKMIDATGETIYAYDQNNRLVGITNPKGEATSFVYDPASRLIEQHQDNGISTFYTYDAANRLLTLENRRSNGTVTSGFSYEYDANGNRTQITEHDGTIWEYTYDGDNRLTDVMKDNVNIQQFEFDPVGNRTQLNQQGYTYDQADRLQSVENGPTFQFDQNGNLIQRMESGETTAYEYDGENRLVKVIQPNGAETIFHYDPFGNRIAKQIGTDHTRFLLDGDNVLMELSPSNAIKARYTSGLALDSWISMERNSNSYFFQADGLGSTVQLTNASGGIENVYEYDAYGNMSTLLNNVENPYTYTGREWEEAVGLYYYRTRFYDAAVGRFLTKDRFRGSVARPLSINRFSYVENSPINYKDPLGLARRGKRRLNVPLGEAAFKREWWRESVNLYHDGFIYDDGTISGFSGSGIGPDDEFTVGDYTLGDKYYNDYILRIAEENVQGRGAFLPNSLWTFNDYNLLLNNCQDYADAVDQEYDRLVKVWTEAFDYLNSIQSIPTTNQCFPSSSGDQSEEKEENADNGNGENPSPPSSEGPICIDIIRSVDPNEIIAPSGYNVQKWVAKDAVLPYTILFENDPDFATAAAQRVVIEHKFDADLNRFSFRLGDFGFGDYYFSVPEDVSYYNTQIDLEDSLGVLLQVTAGLNAVDSMAFWVFESRDPATGLAATLPANTGFLPVNDTLTHVGEGFVNFTISPASNTVTGDLIEAQANIIFDDNAAIETNVDFNTIDADAPESSISQHDENNGVHSLEWFGTDNIDGLMGSGLATYALYRSINDGPFLPIANGLTETTYEFTGSPDSSYCFYVRAKDNVANQEPLKLNCEPACMNVSIADLVPAMDGMANGAIELAISGNAGSLSYEWSHDDELNTNSASGLAAGNYFVTVSDESGCVIVSAFTIENITAVTETQQSKLFLHKLFPVPTASHLTVEFTANTRVVFLEVFDMFGRQIHRQTLEVQANTIQQVQLDVADYPAGNYMVRIKERHKQISGMFIKQ